MFKKLAIFIILLFLFSATVYAETETREKISLGFFIVTAYCPCGKCCGIWSVFHRSRVGTDYVHYTASGTVHEEGRTIAVDTNVIDFGVTVYIDGIGERISEDRGGAIRGNRIDIFMLCHDDALEFGRQRLEVWKIID